MRTPPTPSAGSQGHPGVRSKSSGAGTPRGQGARAEAAAPEGAPHTLPHMHGHWPSPPREASPGLPWADLSLCSRNLRNSPLHRQPGHPARPAAAQAACPGSQPRCGQKPPVKVCSCDAPAGRHSRGRAAGRAGACQAAGRAYPSLLPLVPFAQHLLVGWRPTCPLHGCLCDTTEMMSWSKRRWEAHACRDVVVAGGLACTVGWAPEDVKTLLLSFLVGQFPEGGLSGSPWAKDRQSHGNSAGKGAEPMLYRQRDTHGPRDHQPHFNLSVPAARGSKRRWRDGADPTMRRL